jgi:hypothetical protein
MKKNGRFGRILGSLVITIAAFVAVYLLMVRPWHREWGATGTEIRQAMPGDEVVANPNLLTTRAVTINAKPEEIWPWLVQMGYKRGGLYSYDWLDRMAGILDRPSADQILPEFQDLKPGDDIPMGAGPGWPVKSMDPNRSMVLDIRQPGVHITWSWGLFPVDSDSTRLVLRVRSQMKIKPLQAPLFALLDPAEFVMVRKMLAGIKQRVEGTVGTPTAELLELLSWAVALLSAIIFLISALAMQKWHRSFTMAWVAFLIFFSLALGQPPLWLGAVLILVILRGWFWAFGRRRKVAFL